MSRTAMLAIALAAAAAPGLAADVTSQRLQNPAAEPQNWLMIHHDYDNSRHSQLKDINRDTVKNLQLKFMFSIGGRSTGGTLRGKEESSPLVDDAFPTFDPEYRPGDNLYTASTIALDADTGKMVWYFQETPNEHWDFDTPSPKMLYEVNLNGEPRKVVANFSRNGFFYTLDRNSGQFLRADQYQEKVTWTKGIDPKTGKPADYDPRLDVQRYAGIGQRRDKPGQEACPWYSGSPTFFPPTFDARRMIAYVSGAEGCSGGTTIKTPMDEQKDWVGLRMCCQEQGRGTAHGALWALDVRTGKIVGKARYAIPNESGMLGTDGDLVFTGHSTGRLVAYDADTLQEAWSFNLGTPITAPPMSYSVGGKQYVAVVAGGEVNQRGAVLYQPSAVVAVFGLP